MSSVLERNLLPQDISLNLSPHGGWKEFLDSFRHKYHLHKHSTADEICEAITPEHYRCYEVFTFCRNPFARAYSAYTFNLRADARHRPHSKRYQEIKDMSFEEFLQSRYVQKQELLQSRLQTLWIKESPQPVQVYKLEDVDLVMTGLLEKFFGEEREPSKLPRKNSSVEEFAWKSMSKLAEGLIRDLYSEDFKNLGYPDHIER